MGADAAGGGGGLVGEATVAEADCADMGAATGAERLANQPSLPKNRIDGVLASLLAVDIIMVVCWVDFVGGGGPAFFPYLVLHSIFTQNTEKG